MKLLISVWLNLRKKQEFKRLYVVLEENMIFCVGNDFTFQIHKLPFTLLKEINKFTCQDCKKNISDSVYLPCQHIVQCCHCSVKVEQEFQKCPLGDLCEIDYITKPFRIIKLSDDYLKE